MQKVKKNVKSASFIKKIAGKMADICMGRLSAERICCRKKAQQVLISIGQGKFKKF